MEASKVEDMDVPQEKLWIGKPGLADIALAELLDRIAAKVGPERIRRYLPAEHYWPERSIRPAVSPAGGAFNGVAYRSPATYPVTAPAEAIEVMALLPDYPPKVFTYNGRRHVVVKADGPERIEREWWCDKGMHRDYYAVEDTEGQRYWLFRSGHFDNAPEWFLHGFFA